MGHPVKNRLHCKKKQAALNKHGSNLEKCVALKWITFGKDGSHCEIWKNISKNGSLCKNLSHCGIWVKLKKMGYIQKFGHNV